MRSSLRVLQMHNHHATLGGAVEVMEDEASLLRSAGHQVAQLTTPAAETLRLSPLRAGARAVWNIPIAQQLTNLIGEFRPDVVHVHTPFPLMSPAVFRTASHNGVPTVATMHSYRYSCIAATCHRDGNPCEDCVGKRVKWPGIRHRCYHDSLGASAALTTSLALHRTIGTFDRHVDQFITLTEFARQLLIRDGIRATQITIKPNSVPDTGAVAIPANRRDQFVLFVGRLVAEKGLQTLLTAWSEIDEDVELRIAGDGDLMPIVRQAAARDSRIRPLGWLSREETVEHTRRAAAVVVPSEWYEAGPPLVLLRAQALGSPLVVSDLENISGELLTDKAGITFETGDPRNLAHQLTRLLKDENLRSQLGRNARHGYLRRYTPSMNVTRLEQIYRSVGAGTAL